MSMLPLPRLSRSSLSGIAPDISKPGYDPASTRIGIVHLGIGAFHRAHQAVYVDDLLANDPGWAILGVSLRSPSTADALNPQDGLYTVNMSGTAGIARRVVGAVRGVLVLPRHLEAVLTAMCDPNVRIVSLTVTEKGYCHDPATGELDEMHPDIIADLAVPIAPRSAPGLLVEALVRRRARGIAPFTVLCCDNLPSNGRTVKRIVSRLGALRDPELGVFISEYVAFPCSMVDRIVPATTEVDIEANSAALGAHDAWPVTTEPFSQWVIEDHFPAGRPAFEIAGAQMVADVAPFERMKLRMLNGSHSTLVYLGYLAGYQTVADTIADPGFSWLVCTLMTTQIMPVLDVPAGTDLAAYRDALLVRFANPGLKHRTWQIAMDGSQKLPQRLLGTIRDRLKAGASINLLALGVAGWMRYVAGTDDAGAAIDVRDPLATQLRAIADHHSDDPDGYVAALFELDAIFGMDLPTDPRFTNAVLTAFLELRANGTLATIRAIRTANPDQT
jgi:fructuronate reductase